MQVDITFTDEQVLNALSKLVASGKNMQPLMRRIANHLQASVEQSFADEASPDGKPWAKLKPSTINKRKKLKQLPIKILAGEDSLLTSISSDFDRQSAVAGTNVVYATTHQYGAKKGQFGVSKRGMPIPWGDIPARPFLGVSPKDKEKIQKDAISFISKRFK